MKTEAWPSEEVGDEYDTLVGFGSRDNLTLSRKPVKDFGGEVPSLPKVRDVLLCDKRGHPLSLKAESGHGWRSEALGLSLGYWNSRWGK